MAAKKKPDWAAVSPSSSLRKYCTGRLARPEERSKIPWTK
jgi:hypothetical protein